MWTTAINWERIKEDAGGRWFLNSKSLIGLIPVLTIAGVLSTTSLPNPLGQSISDSPERYLLLVFANLASIAVCWGVVEAANATMFRNKAKKPINWIFVLAFGTTLGFLKGLSTGWFSVVFGSESDLELAIMGRVLNTSLLGLWTIPVVALSAASFARYKLERVALINERLEAELREGSTRGSAQHLDSLKDFAVSAQSLIANPVEGNSQPQNSQDLAKTLRELIDSQLRPISHALWSSTQNTNSEFRLKDFAIVALRKNPFPLLFVALGLLVILLPLNFAIGPPPEAVSRTLVTITLTLGIYGLTAVVSRKLKLSPVLAFLLGNIAASWISTWFTAITFGDSTSVELVYISFALMIWLTQITFFGSLVGEVVESRAEIRAELMSLTGESGLKSAVEHAATRIRSRELAQYVHSNIQNKLLSSALRLETTDLSAEEIQALVSEIRKTLSTVGDHQEVESGTLRSDLLEVIRRWESLVEVELDLKGQDLEVPAELGRVIVQVVSEAISNSVRHGFASKIRVEIYRTSESEQGLEINISDDGLGPRSGVAGLGTELFNTVANRGWSIGPSSEGGTTLTLRRRL